MTMKLTQIAGIFFACAAEPSVCEACGGAVHLRSDPARMLVF